VRYRFYVSSALLRGRKGSVESIGRVSAARIEDAIRVALASHQQTGSPDDEPFDIEQVQRVVIARERLSIGLSGLKEDDSQRKIQIPWSNDVSNSATVIDHENASSGVHNEGLIQAIVRAHAWVRRLADGTHNASPEESVGVLMTVRDRV
jgi:site-specific DNA recombinase